LATIALNQDTSAIKGCVKADHKNNPYDVIQKLLKLVILVGKRLQKIKKDKVLLNKSLGASQPRWV